MRVLMLGAPGSGKGTHGVRIAEKYDVPHVSTGDLLRAQVSEGTAIGREAEPYMTRGDLVPDELILSMVLEKMTGPEAERGYVADGFPRTVVQARAAYDAVVEMGRTLDAVLFLDIPHEELMRRLLERGIQEGRADDTVEAIKHRIEVYEESTRPLLDYYDGRGLLIAVPAVGAIDEVTDRIFTALDERVT